MKKVIILGGTSGIGLSLARQFLANGCTTAITGRREALLAQHKAEDPRLLTKTFDITQTEHLCENLEALVAELGGLDILILSAGVGDLNPTLDYPIEKRTIETNVLGWSCAAIWAMNYFERQKSGHIVTISSIAGMRGSRYAPAYNASKAFQSSYIEGMHQRSGTTKLPVFLTDVRPGFVNTAMAKSAKDVKMFWIMPVEKAARQIFQAIERRKKVVYITKRWAFAALLLRLIPKFIYDKL